MSLLEMKNIKKSFNGVEVLKYESECSFVMNLSRIRSLKSCRTPKNMIIYPKILV